MSGQEQLLSSLPLPDDDWTRSALARGMPPAIAMKLPHLPDGPGVYLWKAIDGTVLYVGKAKRLRSRVRSYWSQDHETSPKTRGLLRKIHELETIVVPSEDPSSSSMRCQTRPSSSQPRSCTVTTLGWRIV